MKQETIYRDKRLEVVAEGGQVFIVKKYDFGGFTAADRVILTATEVSAIVKAWNEMGEIEFAEASV